MHRNRPESIYRRQLSWIKVDCIYIRCDVSEVAATNGTDSLAAVDSTSEITNTNTAVHNSSDSPGTDAGS